MKLFKRFILLILIVTSFYLINTYLFIPNDIKLILMEINSEFSGTVVDKYAIRKTPPTLLRILNNNGEVIEIAPRSKVMDIVQIGDYVFKPMKSNYIYINDSIQLLYIYISERTRSSDYFPDEWRSKWKD